MPLARGHLLAEPLAGAGHCSGHRRLWIRWRPAAGHGPGRRARHIQKHVEGLRGPGGQHAQAHAATGDLEGKCSSSPCVFSRASKKPTAQAGSEVEVGWWILAQHGGGYSYRLAPASEPLTEKAFQKMPLDFVGPSILRWGGDKSTQLEFNATRITEGTFPKGSQWTKNP